MLHREGLDAYVVRRLGLSFRDVDWTRWDDLLERVHHPQHAVTSRSSASTSTCRTRTCRCPKRCARPASPIGPEVTLKWVPSDDCISPTGAAAALSDVDGVVIPGGFGVRGIEGKIGAIRYARENGIPTLGLCLGLQCMTIEVARHLAELEGANSLEFDEHAAHPVIATMADQTDIVAGQGDMGGTMRLGSYPAVLDDDSIVAGVYGTTEVDERHRHRYEVNNSYRDALTKAGLNISGTSPDGHLVEFVELDRALHPYFVATQAHPELKSRPTAVASAVRRAGRRGARVRRPRACCPSTVEKATSAPRDRRQPRARSSTGRCDRDRRRLHGPHLHVVTDDVEMPDGGHRPTRLHDPCRRGRRGRAGRRRPGRARPPVPAPGRRRSCGSCRPG